jgi:hypothetical protein
MLLVYFLKSLSIRINPRIQGTLLVASCDCYYLDVVASLFSIQFKVKQIHHKHHI